MATPADFEEQSLEYDVEGAWKKMRAAHADECWKFIQHQSAPRENLRALPRSTRVSGPGYFVAFQTPAALRCFSTGGTVRSRVKAWAQLVVRQGLVVKAEQLRVKQEKEECRQRTLDSAQAEYEAMDARSFVVALQLEAAGLKRLTTEDKQRGKPARFVDQSSALGSLLVEREDMQHACGIKVRPNSGKNPGVLRAKTPEDFKTKLFDIQVREIQFENECEVHFSNQPKVSEVESFGGFEGFRACQNTGVQGEAAATLPQRTSPAKAKVVVEVATGHVTTATRARHRGQKTAKATRAAEIQVDQWWQQAQAETPIDTGAF